MMELYGKKKKLMLLSIWSDSTHHQSLGPETGDSFLTLPLILGSWLSLATGGWKGFYKWLSEWAFERIDGIFGIELFFW